MKYNPYVLAELCQISYKNKFPTTVWKNNLSKYFNTRSEYSNLEFFVDEESFTEAFAVIRDGVCIITFPGTQDPPDIITDLRSKLFKDETKSYHRGMWYSYCKIEKSIRSYLLSVKPNDVVATGHSLGGGLAKIAALEIESIQNCVTFGAPPITLRSSVIRSGLEIVQFINEADFVPRCMALGADWTPSVQKFLKEVNSKDKKFWSKLSELFLELLDGLDCDLKQYGFCGELRILDDGGIDGLLFDHARLITILKTETTKDPANAIRHHFMELYKKRVATKYEPIGFILGEDTDRRPIDSGY